MSQLLTEAAEVGGSSGLQVKVWGMSGTRWCGEAVEASMPGAEPTTAEAAQVRPAAFTRAAIARRLGRPGTNQATAAVMLVFPFSIAVDD